MINLPAGKMWTADIPAFALAVRRQDERALSCSHQHPHVAHMSLSLGFPACSGVIFPHSPRAAESKMLNKRRSQTPTPLPTILLDIHAALYMMCCFEIASALRSYRTLFCQRCK